MSGLITASKFNGLVAQAAANQRLRGIRREGGGAGPHHWRVRVARAQQAQDFGLNPLTGLPYFSASVFGGESSATRRLWRVFVEPGTVNDRMATITYLRKGDPRGWNMPVNYPGIAEAKKIYGADFKVIDRKLTDPDAPCLLVTAPDEEERDLGGFVKVAAASRPEFFRTRQMSKLNLYVAYVVLTVSPYRADPWETVLNTGGAPPRRWRVRAGKLPTNVVGGGLAGQHLELARLYLTRRPGESKADRLYVQQREFWSIMARPVINQGLLELAAAVAQAVELGTLATLGLGVTGLTVGTALLGIESALVGLLLADFAALVAGLSTLEFWTAA